MILKEFEIVGITQKIRQSSDCLIFYSIRRIGM